MSLYEEEYYNSLNYTDYLGRKDKYYNSAKEMAGLLESIGLLNNNSSILDYGCFVSGTKITLPDLTLKNIEEISVGDIVLSPQGNSRKVVNILQRDSEKTLSIVCPYGIYLETTEEHPVLGVKREDVICRCCKKTTCNTNNSGKCSICKRKPKYRPSYIESRDLKSGDYICIYRPKRNVFSNHVNKNEQEYAELLGFYLAEGSVLYSHKFKDPNKKDQIGGLSFCFHIDEKEYIERVKVLGETLGATSVSIRERKHKTTCEVQVFGKHLSEVIISLGGKGCSTKKLDLKVVNSWSDASIANLLRSWLKGDGSFFKKKRSGARFVGTTTSKNLIQDLKLLFYRLGICVGYHKRKTRPNRKQAYDLIVSGVDIDYLFDKLFGINYPSKKRYRTTEDYIYVPIIGIEEKEELTKVFNLEIEEDESYIANNVCVHNCAVGFLSQSLWELGYYGVCGYDISEWACQQAESNFVKILRNLFDESRAVDIMFCLDVLEHMDPDAIYQLFTTVSAKVLVLRIPVSTNGGESFHLDVSNKDKTHISCYEKKTWVEILSQYGYDVFLPLHLLTIWDSEGVMCNIAIKGNGYK